MKAGLLMGLESPSARAERLARLLAIWDRVPSLVRDGREDRRGRSGRVRAYGERTATEARWRWRSTARSAGPELEALRERLVRDDGRSAGRGASSGIVTERLLLRLARARDFRAWTALRAEQRRFS
jgi:hypothetical protein